MTDVTVITVQQRVTVSNPVQHVVVSAPTAQVSVSQSQPRVTVNQDAQHVTVRSGGMRGLPGLSDGRQTVDLVAVGAISALRVIVSDGLGQARYADTSIASDAGRVVGISLNAAGDGESVVVQSSGPLLDAAWAFAAGPVFCGAGGSLTQTPPAGWILEIARVLASNHLLIGIQTPTLRS